MAAKPKCIIILSTKSAGSSALQSLICDFGGGRHAGITRHAEFETLYWTKAASMLGRPQIRLPDSEVPIPRARADRELRRFVAANVPGFEAPADATRCIIEGWRALCLHHAPVFVEKSPHHLHQWSALELIANAAEALPEIDFRFVGLVRNPMDTLYSAWTRWRTLPQTMQHHWRIALENLTRWQNVVGSSLIIVRYEDFSAKSHTAVRLFDALGLSPVRPGIEQFIHGGSKLKWKFDKRFGFQLDEAVKRTARAFGYSDAELDNRSRSSWDLESRMVRAAHQVHMHSRRSLKRLLHPATA